MGCNTVILTLGDKGAFIGFKGDQNITHVSCDKVTPVDTTVCVHHIFKLFTINKRVNFCLFLGRWRLFYWFSSIFNG